MIAERNRLEITNPFILKEKETTIIKEKFSMLDNTLLFGETSLEINYLQKLHLFLFEDIYYPSQLKFRSEYSNEDLKIVNTMLQNIIFFAEERCLDICYLKDIMYRLWSFQLFSDGNNRTIWAYLKVFINYYELPFELGAFKATEYGHFNMIQTSSQNEYKKSKK